jgi:uncharacterized protein YutE (UPF0331/DUF86 family)
VVNKDLLAAKLTELADRIERVRGHAPESGEALRNDRDKLDLVAFNLMLSVQLCADIASHIIADAGWPAARSLAEAFTRLTEHQVLTPAVAESMRKSVGLRNVVARGYAGIDVEACFVAATRGLSDLQAFARAVSTWANAIES